MIATTAVLLAAAPAPPVEHHHRAPECQTRACRRRTCTTVRCKVRVTDRRWRRMRWRLSPATKAMLARLRGCETRGIPFPSNYRYDGHHDGAYQYDGPTWRAAQAFTAAVRGIRLPGTTSLAHQASPAAQDVVTAAFYPGHRGQWACRA